MMGINLESQLLAIRKFIEKEKRKNYNLYPKNQYAKHIEKNIKMATLQMLNFGYSKDPKILTTN